jgi:hypothetical protein
MELGGADRLRGQHRDTFRNQRLGIRIEASARSSREIN